MCAPTAVIAVIAFRFMHKSWNQRMFVFDRGCGSWPSTLKYFEDASADRDGWVEKGAVNLKKLVSVERLPDEQVAKLALASAFAGWKGGFKVVTAERTWLLVAKTKEELEKWLEVLQPCVAEFKGNDPRGLG